MTVSFRLALCGALLLVGPSLSAQEAKPAPVEAQPKLPQIADEPKTVDPATLMPAQLAAAATVDLSDSSLRELVDWLQNERKIAVLLHENALNEIGVSPAEPLSERLDDAPIYLLLNRLRSLDLAWFFEDDVLHITTVDESESRLTTIPYNIGDLVDSGYSMEDVQAVVTDTIAPETWDSVGGPGALSFLGDVMFVRQTDGQQREIQGLLAALRKHSRQTFIFDPPQHLALRQELQEKISVDFRDMPLEAAIKQLAEKAKIDIRLDIPALRDIGLRERAPVTLKLSEHKLETILQGLVVNLKLTWVLRDGALWITSPESAEALLKTAVYDVRDLCRDAEESNALMEALSSQTEPSVWSNVGGPGDMHFARPGTLVIYNGERIHQEVLELLETYRAALRASRPREKHGVEPNEVITVYYRLHANVAGDLESLLPKLVQPGTWKGETAPEAPGEIFRASSKPDLTSSPASAPSNDAGNIQTMVVARAVLIVRQTREAHEEIAEVIRRVERGDAAEGLQGGFGGGGFGGGGFGGGFF